MTKNAPHNHRHHKRHTTYRGKQAHDGGGKPISEEEGLQLPQMSYQPIPWLPRIIYPKGWRFNQLTPGRAFLLLFGGFFVLVLLIAALGKLLAG
jgi:hypothetical protein